jgi:hypothetical protein
MNHDDRDVNAYIAASIRLRERFHVEHQLYGERDAMPLPTPRAANSEAASGEVEGGTGRAAEGVSGDGLQPEAQLLRREPELLEGAGRDADRAPEECERIAGELASEGAVK